MLSFEITLTIIQTTNQNSIKELTSLSEELIMRNIFLLAFVIFAIISGNAFTSYKDIAVAPDSARLSELYHDVEYFLPAGHIEETIAATMLAREEMSWGATISDEEFLHFVMPVRVNNEVLDNSRPVFYKELRDRVRGKTMGEAALEVNHWCHEKVTYHPSDARTSSPLSTLSQGIGRCGEESTFLVAALRAVCLPARQVYTPRWAHTDDNHAWVEVLTDGEWRFLGACEPEPVLNLAWFNAPASRGMLMTTKVAGSYMGKEEVLDDKSPVASFINVTSNYAPVREIEVLVVDSLNNPVAGASVDFCIYNYAEYYPAVERTTDKSGKARVTAGMGDMIVKATDGSRLNIVKSSPGEHSPLVIMLNKKIEDTESVDFDIVPPPERVTLPRVSEYERMENDRRLAREDSIRNSYYSTFSTPGSSYALAEKYGLSEETLEKILAESRGNHQMIETLLSQLEEGDRASLVRLLQVITEKDRRDVSREVLLDHLYNSVIDSDYDRETVERYVINPRIETEPLSAFKSELRSYVTPERIAEWKESPERLSDFVAERVKIDPLSNPLGVRFAPSATIKRGVADRTSADILFVALARTAGIPARLNPVTANREILSKTGEWICADAYLSEDDVDSNGRIEFDCEGGAALADPLYYTHFTISRIEDGKFRLMEYDENATAGSINGSAVAPGRYILTTGRRMADGEVLAHSEFFTVEAGQTTRVNLKLREDDSKVSVIGSFDSENLFQPLSGEKRSILSATGRGYYILGLLKANHEPSIHAINDLKSLSEELESVGNKIVLLFDSEEDLGRQPQRATEGLPSTVVMGSDIDGKIRGDIADALHLDSSQSPIFIIADTFNRIVFVSTGYNIGVGRAILDTIHKL